MTEDMVRVTYLLNSGFVVEGEGFTLVFDAFRDADGAMERAARRGGSLFFFVSHAHFDHYSPEIARFSALATRFFLSSDILGMGRAAFPREKTTWLSKYDGYEDESIRVTSFDSTDEGTCFLVRTGGWRIFHAGDFNWWHWALDTPENIGFARNGFFKQLKKMEGMEPDLAFFPADGRLEEARSWGAREFSRAAAPRALITMHSVGYPRFEPGADFFEPGRDIPLWSPTEPGEAMIFERGKGFLRS